MKYRVLPITTMLILSALLIVFFGAKQQDNSKKEQVLLEQVLRGLTMIHFEPLTLNDEFSKAVFDEYLNGLDFNKKFFLQSDINQLSSHQLKIDNQLAVRDISFFEAVEGIITRRMKEASEHYRVILADPFDFTVTEEIELDGKKNSWAADQGALFEEWRKALKYQVMLRIHSDLEIQESALEKGDTLIEQRTFEEIERAARESVERTHADYFDRMLKLNREDRYGMFLNALGGVTDPHTNYYPPKIRDDFDIAMSGRLEGIGAVLTQRSGYIQVEEIMPGSPSWKGGELKSGDIILKVAQGDEEPVDVTSMRLDEAVRLIRGPKGTEARLTVRKKITEEIVIISIIRDVVEMEQTYARSAIITSDNGKRVGYLFLPKFYVDFNNPVTGRHCAGDVREELEKLTSEGIDALVFDLRNNGGGSLQDVVKITGYFIPRGPVVQVRDKLAGHEVMRDNDPDVLWDGPMVVMVNSGSASASEIMAAALQDYQRAVIVGSASTFGKGTVQRMIDLDMMVPPADAAVKPIGSLKITTQKFYRINGGATQLRGVVSDVILPDRYDYIDFGEKSLVNAMTWTRINPVNFQPWTHGVAATKERLVANSAVRIGNHPVFQAIDEYARKLHQQQEQTMQTLHLEQYRAKQAQRKAESDAFNTLIEQETPLNISLTKADRQKLDADTVRTRVMNDWIKALQKDVFLEETRHIVHDMLDPGNKAGRSTGRIRR